MNDRSLLGWVMLRGLEPGKITSASTFFLVPPSQVRLGGIYGRYKAQVITILLS
jgi:hypothetical protein